MDQNKGGKFVHYTNIEGDQSSLINNEVMCIHARKNGEIWVGTEHGGLHRFNSQAKNFKRYTHNPNNPNSLSNNNITCIFEDKAGELWIGTSSGLNKFEPDIEGFIHYIQEPGNLSSLSHNYVGSIHEGEKSNILWISTGGGLTKFDRAKEILQNLKNYFTIYPLTINDSENALDIQIKYKYSYWDSLILSSAINNECSILYSEDLQHNQIIKESLKIINPFNKKG